jgi:hypothetical protein
MKDNYSTIDRRCPSGQAAVGGEPTADALNQLTYCFIRQHEEVTVTTAAPTAESVATETRSHSQETGENQRASYEKLDELFFVQRSLPPPPPAVYKGLESTVE